MSLSEVCLDMDNPRMSRLCAKYKRTFAYHTVHDRLPVILTQVIDHLSRDKDKIAEEYGEECREDIKSAIGYVSRLKSELQTNKPLVPLTAEGRDFELWNEFLTEAVAEFGPLTWYGSTWLYIESYMYQRCREAFKLTKTLKHYDPFSHLKDSGFINSLKAINTVGSHILQIEKNPSIDVHRSFIQLLKLSLWSNRCDLSLSAGEDASQTKDPLQMVEELDDLILVDKSEEVWKDLTEQKRPRVVDIVFDNSGYELFADLCLADLMIKFSLADKVRFHMKRVPWYVSDVTLRDFDWTLDTIALQGGNSCLPVLAEHWKSYIKSGKWSLFTDDFWTLPYEFDRIKTLAPELFSTLQEASLVIFKGDLNYRKLVGDINWPHETSFKEALKSFTPTTVVTLRTMKADIVVGLKEGQAEKTAQVDPDWMITGKYAVIDCYVKES